MGRAKSTVSETTRQCSWSKPSSTGNRLVKWTTAGGMLAAFGVCVACCLLPFVLLSVGVAGAWVSRLDALAPYKWIFIALTAALLGYGFYVAYWRPRRICAAGATCEACGTGRSVRVALWAATILALGGIVFAHVEPVLTHSP